VCASAGIVIIMASKRELRDQIAVEALRSMITYNTSASVKTGKNDFRAVADKFKKHFEGRSDANTRKIINQCVLDFKNNNIPNDRPPSYGADLNNRHLRQLVCAGKFCLTLHDVTEAFEIVVKKTTTKTITEQQDLIKSFQLNHQWMYRVVGRLKKIDERFVVHCKTTSNSADISNKKQNSEGIELSSEEIKMVMNILCV